MKNAIWVTTLAATTLIGLSAGAMAQGYYSDAPAYQPGPRYEGRSAETYDQYRYDRSGTAGRIGLGASPMHPEGPGNVVTPSR